MFLYCISTSNTGDYRNTRSNFTSLLPETIDTAIYTHMQLGLINYEAIFDSVSSNGTHPHLVLSCNPGHSEIERISSEAQYEHVEGRLYRIAVREWDSHRKPYKIIAYADSSHNITYLVYLKPARYVTSKEIVGILNSMLRTIGASNYMSFLVSKKSEKIEMYKHLVMKVHILAEFFELLGFNIYAVHITRKIPTSVQHLQFEDCDFKKYSKNTSYCALPEWTSNSVALNQYNPSYYTPSLIKIFCNNIEENICGSGYKKLLSTCPAPTSNDGMFNFFTYSIILFK